MTTEYTSMEMQDHHIWYQSSSDPRELPEAELTVDSMHTEHGRTLLITVYDAYYPITEDLLHQLFDKYGKVEMIHILPRNQNFQAFLRYEFFYSLVSAKLDIHGRNVYDGCCRLDLRYVSKMFLENALSDCIATVEKEVEKNEVVKPNSTVSESLNQSEVFIVERELLDISSMDAAHETENSLEDGEITKNESQVFDEIPVRKLSDQKTEEVNGRSLSTELMKAGETVQSEAHMLDDMPVKDQKAEGMGFQVFDEMSVKEMNIVKSLDILINDGQVVGSCLQRKSDHGIKNQDDSEEEENHNNEGKISLVYTHDDCIAKDIFDPGGYIDNEWILSVSILINFGSVLMGVNNPVLAFQKDVQIYSLMHIQDFERIVGCLSLSNICWAHICASTNNRHHYIIARGLINIIALEDILNALTRKVPIIVVEDMHGSFVILPHYSVVIRMDIGSRSLIALDYEQNVILFNSSWALAEGAVSWLTIDEASSFSNLFACKFREKNHSRLVNGSKVLVNQIFSGWILKKVPWFKKIVGSYWTTCIGWFIAKPYELDMINSLFSWDVLYGWSYFERGKNAVCTYEAILAHFWVCNRALGTRFDKLSSVYGIHGKDQIGEECLALKTEVIYAHILGSFSKKITQGGSQLVVFHDTSHYHSLCEAKVKACYIKNMPFMVPWTLVCQTETFCWRNEQVKESGHIVHEGAEITEIFLREDFYAVPIVLVVSTLHNKIHAIYGENGEENIFIDCSAKLLQCAEPWCLIQWTWEILMFRNPNSALSGLKGCLLSSGSSFLSELILAAATLTSLLVRFHSNLTTDIGMITLFEVMRKRRVFKLEAGIPFTAKDLNYTIFKTIWLTNLLHSALTRLILWLFAPHMTLGTCTFAKKVLVLALLALALASLEILLKFIHCDIVEVNTTRSMNEELQSLRTRINSTGGKCHDPSCAKEERIYETRGRISWRHVDGQKLHHNGGIRSNNNTVFPFHFIDIIC